MLDFGGSWKDYLHLMEFSYRNSYQNSINMAPFEALYGKNIDLPSIGIILVKKKSYCVQDDCLNDGKY